MKNDLIFADAELRCIPVNDDAVFRMANARAAIQRALEKCVAAEQAKEKPPEDEPGKEETEDKKKTEDEQK